MSVGPPPSIVDLTKCARRTLMLPFLSLMPVATSLILGIVYLFHGDGPPAVKIAGTVVFGTALYLQFFSSHALFGLLLQIAVALALALWRRVETAT